MEFNSFLQSLGDNDVLSFSNTNMYKTGNFIHQLRAAIDNNEVAGTVVNKLEASGIKGLGFYNAEKRVSQNQLWMTEGKQCEVLKVGAQDWIKGRLKVRVIVEFEPDTPEPPASTLDDIRQMISE